MGEIALVVDVPGYVGAEEACEDRVWEYIFTECWLRHLVPEGPLRVVCAVGLPNLRRYSVLTRPRGLDPEAG